MPENNCSQKLLIRNLCGPMRHECWQNKVQKGTKILLVCEILALQARGCYFGPHWNIYFI